MVVAIVIAFVVTIVILALAKLVEQKLCPRPIAAEWVWCVWVIAILLILIAWWRLVLAQFVGPLP